VFWLGERDPDGIAKLQGMGFTAMQLDRPFAIGTVTGPIMMVVDSVHRKTLSHLDDYRSYIHALRKVSSGLALIDAGGKDAVRERLGPGAWDIAIAPYVGEPAGRNVFAGAHYCILDRRYENLPRRVSRSNASAVLVTCGGSDPRDVSGRILEAVELLPSGRLDIRVVVGAAFSPQARRRLNDLAARSRHTVTQFYDPSDMSAHMSWADVVVATSGLTKYELAAAGAPAILISLDEDQWQINASFAAERTAWDGGHVDSFDGPRFVADLARLLSSRNDRQKLADRGQALVDGLGRHRTFEQMEKLFASRIQF
jgi:hypothetical protein